MVHCGGDHLTNRLATEAGLDTSALAVRHHLGVIFIGPDVRKFIALVLGKDHDRAAWMERWRVTRQDLPSHVEQFGKRRKRGDLTLREEPAEMHSSARRSHQRSERAGQAVAEAGL